MDETQQRISTATVVPLLKQGLWLSTGCRFESRPGLLRTKVYSAFHPSGVGGKEGKAKAGMVHSDCRWTCGCAGRTAKSLENTCHTWALLRWWFTTKSESPPQKRSGMATSSVCTFTFTFRSQWRNSGNGLAATTTTMTTKAKVTKRRKQTRC